MIYDKKTKTSIENEQELQRTHGHVMWKDQTITFETLS